MGVRLRGGHQLGDRVLDGEYVKNPCERCGHSPDWHSFTGAENSGRDVTDPTATFSCNGANLTGCDLACPDFAGEPLTFVGGGS